MDFSDLKNTELLAVIADLDESLVHEIYETVEVSNPHNCVKNLMLSVIILLDLKPEWEVV